MSFITLILRPIGTKELLEKITLVDPDSFNKGRAILKEWLHK